MTAKQVLNAKAGQKVGLGNGLRLICDKRDGRRYFELRKRLRGKDYSWGVGSKARSVGTEASYQRGDSNY